MVTFYEYFRHEKDVRNLVLSLKFGEPFIICSIFDSKSIHILGSLVRDKHSNNKTLKKLCSSYYKQEITMMIYAAVACNTIEKIYLNLMLIETLALFFNK